MKKTRFLSLIGILLIALFIVSCGQQSGGQQSGQQSSTEKPKLICGVTIYEPMNYVDDDGEWTGFDTEFALLVGEKLSMDVEFQEIDWGRKFIEVESGAISCIWNGFTANVVDSVTGRPRIEEVDMSYSYMLNQQCVVVKSERAGEFTSIDDLSGKIAATEKARRANPLRSRQ